jgi:hypothetical protein
MEFLVCEKITAIAYSVLIDQKNVIQSKLVTSQIRQDTVSG